MTLEHLSQVPLKRTAPYLMSRPAPPMGKVGVLLDRCHKLEIRSSTYHLYSTPCAKQGRASVLAAPETEAIQSLGALG